MCVLLIFIKNPVIGKVKTRIAQTAGDEEALRIYNELLRHTREVCLAVDADRWLFYSSFIDDHDAWPEKIFEKKLQEAEGNLGQKMYAAFRQGLTKHSKTVIIGSDCAQITPEIIEAAFKSLDNHEVVIGPATDGGYYLLGMKRLIQSVFQNKPWSQPDLLQVTCKELERMAVSYHLLPELSDIDREEDWKKFGW